MPEREDVLGLARRAVENHAPYVDATDIMRFAETLLAQAWLLAEARAIAEDWRTEHRQERDCDIPHPFPWENADAR